MARMSLERSRKPRASEASRRALRLLSFRDVAELPECRAGVVEADAVGDLLLGGNRQVSADLSLEVLLVQIELAPRRLNQARIPMRLFLGALGRRGLHDAADRVHQLRPATPRAPAASCLPA